MAVTMDAGTPGVKKKSRQQLIKEEIQRKKQANKARWNSRMYRAGGDKKAAYMNLAALPPKTKKGNADGTTGGVYHMGQADIEAILRIADR